MFNHRNDSDGRREGKSPEKSNFVQTCNLLSQFVKRKGSLKDLNLEIGGKVESLDTIVNHRSHYDVSPPVDMNSVADVENSNQPPEEPQPRSDPFPGNAMPNSSIDMNTVETTGRKLNSTAQLTMFYGDRVLIFDEYPEHKAKELVAMAKKGSSQMSYGIFSHNFLLEKPNPSAAATSISSPRDGRPPRPQFSSSQRHSVISSNTFKADHSGATAWSSKAKESLSLPPEANGSDMPIARRSSLHRFLEKRKDRAGGRGPYQIQEQEAASSSKGDEQLELRL